LNASHSTPSTVLITGARAPVALHLARLFHGAGWRVVMADSIQRPISAASACCSRYFSIPSPRFEPSQYGDAIDDILTAENPALVVPSCEEVFYLANLWMQRRFTHPLFAPEFSLLGTVHNKFKFIELCRALKLETPDTRLIENVNDLKSYSDQAHNLVFKQVWSRFAKQIFICPSAEQLAQINPTSRMPWIAQTFVRGQELSAYAVARNGKLVALSVYQCRYRAGQGAGIYFEPVTSGAIHKFIDRFITGTNWNGQVSFDFIEMQNGEVLPLECNPRATSGLHFFQLPTPFVDAITLRSGDGLIKRHKVPQTLPLAMWYYGLPKALHTGKMISFLKDLNRAEHILEWPADNGPKRGQWRSFLEMITRSMRHRSSLQQASTYDIEWNGPN